MAKLRPLDTSGRQRRYAEIISSQESGCGKNWISNRYAFSLRSTAWAMFPQQRTRSISASPPAAFLLKKLRDHFADPLFVRVGQRMIPTPRADAIAPTISTLLQLADNDLAVKPEFLPQQSQRNFTIGMTDISQMTLLPLLQIALQQQAADGITFTVQNLDEQTLNALESGKCDLAIGYLTQLPESVYQQHLFDQSYVCLAAENHPRIRAQLRAEDWRQEKHLAIRVEGTAHGDMDKLLDEHHMPRRIALTLPSF